MPADSAYVDTSVLGAYYCPEPLSGAAEAALLELRDPCISPLALGDHGNAGRGQRPDQIGITSHGTDAGYQCLFKHISGKARILANNYFSPVTRAFKQMRNCAANLQCCFSGNRFNISNTAYSVGSEQSCHCNLLYVL